MNQDIGKLSSSIPHLLCTRLYLFRTFFTNIPIRYYERS